MGMDAILGERNRSSAPKYRRLADLLSSYILSGVFHAGDRLPSEQELRCRYGFSHATIKRAVAEVVRQGLAYTVQGKGWFVAHRPAVSSQQVHPGGCDRRRPPIALVWSYYANDFCARFLRGVLDELRDEGPALEMYDARDTYRRENEIFAALSDRPLSGILFLPGYADRPYRHLVRLTERGVPCVLVDSWTHGVIADCVFIDNRDGMRRAVAYLIARGHRRIVYIGRRSLHSVVAERFRGYCDALQARGIPVSEELVWMRNDDTYASDQDEGYAKTISALAAGVRFTAIAAQNDATAAGAFRALCDKGLRVPDHVSLIGFDDSTEARFLPVGLTTVAQDVSALGSTAVRLLRERMTRIKAAPRQTIVLKTILVRRHSVRRLLPARARFVVR